MKLSAGGGGQKKILLSFLGIAFRGGLQIRNHYQKKSGMNDVHRRKSDLSWQSRLPNVKYFATENRSSRFLHRWKALSKSFLTHFAS